MAIRYNHEDDVRGVIITSLSALSSEIVLVFSATLHS